MKSPRLLPVLCAMTVLSAISPAYAAENSCPASDDDDNCTRVLACVGDTGRWFNGRAFGRGEGTFAGLVNDGTACSGTWVSRNAYGVGQGNVQCDDGMESTVLYFFQDEHSGTAIGRGRTTHGDMLTMWSGNHVLQYLRAENGTPHATLPCGTQDIPIS